MHAITGEEKEVQFDALPAIVKEALICYQQRELDPTWEWDDFLEDYTFRMAKMVAIDRYVVLPYAHFDMRGDGDTHLLKKDLVNLEVIAEQVVYAVGTVLCKQTDDEAYAFYSLDDKTIVIAQVDDDIEK